MRCAAKTYTTPLSGGNKYETNLINIATELIAYTHVYGSCAVRWGVIKVCDSKHIQRYWAESTEHHANDEYGQVCTTVVHLVTRTPARYDNKRLSDQRLLQQIRHSKTVTLYIII